MKYKPVQANFIHFSFTSTTVTCAVVQSAVLQNFTRIIVFLSFNHTAVYERWISICIKDPHQQERDKVLVWPYIQQNLKAHMRSCCPRLRHDTSYGVFTEVQLPMQLFTRLLLVLKQTGTMCIWPKWEVDFVIYKAQKTNECTWCCKMVSGLTEK